MVYNYGKNSNNISYRWRSARNPVCIYISNKICQMFVIPRSNLAYLNEQEKLHKSAFYILIGEDESTKPQAYIGETENFRE